MPMRRPFRSMPLRQRGVALIEVLVAILIFSIAILGLVALQAQAISLSLEADYRSRASLLADELAGKMWAYKTVDLSTVTAESGIVAAWQAKIANPQLSRLPSGSGTVTAVAGSVPPAADIVITWTPPSRSGANSASSFSTRVILPSL
ncbi:type IV pilus assembly protein PilV [Pseudacidovorax sp. RU35E]|nr:type IV pilus assembly protein PilV [Pseudacidovorax sp. RU35E]